jgi:acyl-CoA dehydrogenase
MAAIRMHLAKKGLGLFNDLQNEHSVVGNFPDILMVKEFGTEGMVLICLVDGSFY